MTTSHPDHSKLREAVACAVASVLDMSSMDFSDENPAEKEEFYEKVDRILAAIRPYLPTPATPARGEERVLTCVYCGHEYPQDTPAHGAKILTDHIKVCEKHPMRKLRTALANLVGVDGETELSEMEAAIRLTPAPMADKIAVLDAIHALRETLT